MRISGNNSKNSENLRWQVKRELDNEKISKNKEKVIGILKKNGLNEAPEDITRNLYRNNIEHLGTIYLNADSKPEIPEMKLTDDSYYYKSGNCISVVRKKTKEELKQEKEEARTRTMSSRHGQISAIENKMKDERKSFIRSILDTNLKEDVCDRLWKLIMSGRTTVELKSIICLLAGKEFSKIKESDREEYKAKAESLDTVKQMLCIIEQEVDMSVASWDNHYNAKNAEKVIEFTNILEKFGFSYEDEDEYMLLLGTHELFEKDKASEYEDTEETEVSDVVEDSDIPVISEDVEISEEADDSVETDAYADVTDEAVAEDVSIAA